MAQREQLPFRPLDNGSKTQMGYNLEAEHWHRAFKKAKANDISSAKSFAGAMGTGGAILSLFVNAVVLLFLVLGVFFKWFIKACENTPAENAWHEELRRKKMGICDGTNGYWTHTDGINRPYPQDPEEVDPNWMTNTHF
ncbi:MAG: hypothetical protein EOO51_09185 [Flavobacterium sp.]|nr:MAG: hypothetical protein EOO51_09185 [Flavobacterium sp.]